MRRNLRSKPRSFHAARTGTDGRGARQNGVGANLMPDGIDCEHSARSEEREIRQARRLQSLFPAEKAGSESDDGRIENDAERQLPKGRSRRTYCPPVLHNKKRRLGRKEF